MRCLISFLFLFVASTLEAQLVIDSYRFASASTLNNGVMFHFSLDENGGNRVDSEPTNPNTLAEVNGVTNAPGIIGSAAFFEKANFEYLEAPDATDLSVGNEDFTFSAWVKPVTITSDMHIMSHYTVSPNQRSWRMWCDSGANRFTLGLSADGIQSTNIAANDYGVMVTNVWQHIVVQHDAVNNQMTIIVNATNINTLPYNGGVHNSTGVFQVGARPTAGFFDGAIDECVGWRRVLTPAEVIELNNAGAGLTYPYP